MLLLLIRCFLNTLPLEPAEPDGSGTGKYLVLSKFEHAVTIVGCIVSVDGTQTNRLVCCFGILKSNDCGSYSGFSDHRLKLENGAVHTVEMKPLKDVYLDTQKFSEDNHCKFDFSKDDDLTFEILRGEINGDSYIDQQVMKIIIQV